MKKYRKFIGTAVLVVAVMLIVTGCATHKTSAYTPPSGGFYGWIFTWIGKPLQNIMLQCYRIIGGTNGAGWAIILMTLVVRTILLPLMLNQQKKSTTQQEKMARVQPQMLLIQNAMKRKDMTQDQQMTLATWQRELYSKNNLSLTGGMGCLPLLIQMPIMIGIYQAVMYSRVLANSKFLGISLSERSLLVAIIATVFALAQSYLSMVGIPKEQKKQMQSMLLMNPIMTLFISLTVSGSVALYWAAGNFFSLIQQVIVTYIIMPRVKKNVEKELKEQPIKEIVTQAKIDALFSENKVNPEVKKQNQELHQNLRNRNKGKQQRRH
ncbi:membrane protein insertase YidC [Lactobacillus sp. ESL0791]|uniref:membrane protein insertase YidC n=1 Tax=Lactobacillus sp. ESL0791 TaxID=2983234 RepID=UPI0023F9A116|nr:membrane protein insertase YidC [Lactobacillus sp. ESL0791]MDF7639160.1 membrane protein insertase YidC [Lactobacillus sp. ESL0791]